jgi:hypothetical protein
MIRHFRDSGLPLGYEFNFLEGEEIVSRRHFNANTKPAHP